MDKREWADRSTELVGSVYFNEFVKFTHWSRITGDKVYYGLIYLCGQYYFETKEVIVIANFIEDSIWYVVQNIFWSTLV